MRTRRFLYLAMILLAVLMLAACRNGRAGNQQNENQTSEPATTIRFADEGFKEGLYSSLIRTFQEENPGVAVEFVPLSEATAPGSNEVDFFRLASLADAMVLPRSPESAEGDYFQDLGPMLTAASLTEESFWPGALAACQAGERQAALPLYVMPRVVFVHGDVLAAAGADVPAADWTWSDFAELVQAVGESGEPYGFVQRGSPAELLGPTLDQLLPAGSTRPNPAELAEATNWYVTLVREGHVALAGEDVDVEALITGGQAAMWVESPAQLPGRQSALGEDVVILPFPGETAGGDSTPVQPACAAISAGTSQPELAWAWLDFLAQHPIVARRGEVPAQPAVADSSGFWQGFAESTAELYRYALEHAWYERESPAVVAVAAALNEALLSDTDTAEAIEAIGELPTPTPVPTPAGTPVVVGAAPTVAPLGDGNGLQFFSNARGSVTAIRNAADEWTRTSGMPVELFDFFALSQLPEAAADGSNLIDLMLSNADCFLWDGTVDSFVQERVVPLDELLAANQPELLADYDPATLEQVRTDGVLYNLPLSLWPQVISYNAERFERKGLEPLTAGMTMEELIAVAAEMPLGEGDGQIYGLVPFGFPGEGDPYAFWAALLGAQPYDLAADPPLVQFTAPETVQAVESMGDLVERRIMPAFVLDGSVAENQNYNRLEDVIQDGRGTIWNESLGAAQGRAGFDRLPFNMRFVTPPPSDVPLPAPDILSIYISAHSENVDACVSWAAHLSTEPAAFDGVPARLSVQESAEWEALVGAEEAANLRDLVARSTQGHADSLYVRAVRLWWMDALATIFAGSDVATELATVQEMSETYLDCLGGNSTPDVAQTNACGLEADPDFPVLEVPETP